MHGILHLTRLVLLKRIAQIIFDIYLAMSRIDDIN